MKSFRVKLVGCKEQEQSARQALELSIAEKYGISPDTVSALFSRLPTTFKDNLDEDEANSLAEQLDQMGAQVEIENTSKAAAEKHTTGSGLSLVGTDVETGTIENITIESEKSIAPPSNSLSFEFDISYEDEANEAPPSEPEEDNELILNSSKQTKTSTTSSSAKEDLQSIADELSKLSLSELDFEPQEEEPEEEEYSVEEAEEENIETVDEIDSDPYSTDIPVGRHQTEPFNEIVDPNKSKEENRQASKTAQSAFGTAANKSNVEVREEIELPINSSKKSRKLLAIGATLTLLICIPMLFLLSRNTGPQQTITWGSQFEKLLKLQDQIKSSGQDEETAPTKEYVRTNWTGEGQENGITTSVTLTLLDDKIGIINLFAQEQEPARLTPKQIVDNVPEPLWLDKLEIEGDLQDSPVESKPAVLSSKTYIRQRNAKIPSRRMVIPVQVEITRHSKDSVTLKWDLSHGKSAQKLENQGKLNENQELNLHYSSSLSLTPAPPKKKE